MRNKIIRVFISSTFEDMKRERTILQEKIYPYLVNTYTPKGWQIEFVDLRWGISKEAGTMQKTMRICLEELKRCQQVSPRPNFLILQGERYGWRPLPEIIPLNEWNAIIAFAQAQKETEIIRLLEEWYTKDENNIPHCMELMPRRGIYIYDYNEYCQQVENPLIDFFTLFGHTMLSGKEKYKYTTSATEQEIFAGALSENVFPEQVIAYFRNINDLAYYPEQNHTFVDSPERATYAQKAIKNLAQAIKKKLHPEACTEIKCSFQEYTSGLKDEIIENRLKHLLTAIIDSEIAYYSTHPTLAWQAEIERQQEFITERILNFQGRTKELLEIHSAPKGQFILLEGMSGTGKSSLMAKAFQNINEEINKKTCNEIVLFRTIGIGNTSSTFQLIESIWQELGKDCNFVSIQEATSQFREFLQKYKGKKNITLFIDALDQLPRKETIAFKEWIPNKISPQIKLIISIIEGTIDFSAHHPQIIPVEGLNTEKESDNIRTAILTDSLGRINRTITEEQKQKVFEAYEKGGSKPLFLKIIADIASRWKHNARILLGESYSEQTNDQGKIIITIPDNVECLIEGFLKILMLPENFGLIVEKSFAYLLFSRRGVSDGELISILSADKEFMEYFHRESFHKFKAIVTLFPPIIWTRLYYEIKRLLTNRAVSGGNVLSFYHRQVENGVIKFLSNTNRQQIAKVISLHFLDRYDNFDARTLEELPYSLNTAGEYDKLLEVLTDIDFIHSKITKGFLLDLLEDYKHAIRLISRILENGSDIENKLEQGSTIGIHEIYTMTKLRYGRFLLNILLKFIQQETYKFLDFASIYKYWTLQSMRNAYKNGPIRELTDKYLDKHHKTDIELYIRRNSPEYNPQAAIKEKLQGHDWCIRAICTSSDFSTAISASDDQSCIVWNLHDGLLVKRLHFHHSQVTSIAADSNCTHVISADTKGHAVVWNAVYGDELWNSKSSYETIRSVGMTADGSRYAILHEQKGQGILDIYSSDSHTRIQSFDRFGDISCFCFTRETGDIYFFANGDLYFSRNLSLATLISDKYHGNNTITKIRIDANTLHIAFLVQQAEVHLFSLAKKETITRLAIEGLQIIDFDMDDNPHHVILASGDNKLHLWNIRQGSFINTLIGHFKDITSVALSSDGHQALSGSRDRRCILWNTEAGMHTNELGTAFGSCVYMSRPQPDGTTYAGSDTDYLMKWNRDDARGMLTPIQAGEIYAMDISADGRKLAWSNGDKIGQLFDIQKSTRIPILKNVHNTFVNSIRFSPSGRYIFANAVDEKGSSLGYILSVSDARDGRLVAAFTESELGVHHPWKLEELLRGNEKCDGSHPVTKRYSADLIETAPNKNKYFIIHINSAYATALSPDSTLLAIACRDNTAIVYDLKNHKKIKHLGCNGEGHQNEVKAVAFTPDGTRLISGSWDNSCILWDLRAREGEEKLAQFKAHNRGIYALDIAQDGKTFISGGRDKSCIVWDIDKGIMGQPAIINIYTADSACNSVYFRNNGFIAGFDNGEVITTENTLGTILKAVPIVTIGRVWNFEKDTYDEFSYVCPHCGKRIYEVRKQLEYIERCCCNITHPALELEEYHWNASILNSLTPCCNNKIKFNPFISWEKF